MEVYCYPANKQIFLVIWGKLRFRTTFDVEIERNGNVYGLECSCLKWAVLIVSVGLVMCVMLKLAGTVTSKVYKSTRFVVINVA